MANRVDDIDASILNELRINARISLAKLGERVRLSRNAVRQRIERLEREGQIAGYTIKESADLAPSRVSAFLFIQRIDRVRGYDVIAGLRAIPEVVVCDVVSGELDMVVKIEADDVARIREIWRSVSEFPGVKDITTAVCLAAVIER